MNIEEKLTINRTDYLDDLSKIKETIRTNQNEAIVAVNSHMIMAYYEIGTMINQRKSWGNKYVEKLSNDLKGYGVGYSIRNLKYMSQFAKEFSIDGIRQQPVAQISWCSIITIMTKCKNHKEQLWYVSASKKNGWGKDMLLNQITMKAYELNQ